MDRRAVAPTAAVLCDLFAEVLGLDEVAEHEDFFDLGGHSLLAMRVLHRVDETLGVDVPVNALFEAPTPLGLSEWIARGDRGSSLDVLLTLRAGGDRTPLFCVHPGAGMGWAYSALLRTLAPDRPVYAVQSRGLDRDGPLPATVAEVAEDYLDVIREVQPHGPYALLGWSFGGVVAHEMTRRAQQARETVRLLVLLDAYPRPGADESPNGRSILDSVLSYLGYETGVIATEPDPVARANELLRTHLGVPLLDEALCARLSSVEENNGRLATSHRPGVVHGDVMLFVAEEDRTPDVGSWQPFVTGQVHERVLPCGHNDLMRPGPAEHIGLAVEEWLADDEPTTGDRRR